MEPNLNLYRNCQEHVPKQRRISVSSLHERHKAVLKYRGFIAAPYFGNTPIQIVDWMTKNKLNYFLFGYPNSDEGAKEWRKMVML